MEHLVFRIGEILEENHSVEVVGPQRVSPRIAERFPCTAWSDIQPVLLWRLLCRDPVTRRIVRLISHAKHSKPDALLALGSIGVNGLAVAIAGRIVGVPAIVRLTSDVFNVYTTKRGWTAKLSLFVRNNILGRLSMKLADRVLLLHEAQRQEITDCGVSSAKIRVVPQPIKFAAQYRSDDKNVRSELEISPEARVILSSMRLDTDKHIELLVEVINQVLETSENPNCHFIIVGDGECRVHVEEATQLHRQHVHIVGEQPSNNLPSYYRAADLYLHLSKGEGLSNCLIEALYFQLPVIATDSGTITRGMISTILETPSAIINTILKGDVPVDPLPQALLPNDNKTAWLAALKPPFNH
ncbi:glycosyltransferase family 4 protein [Spiribacter roseus]|uniref:glycosyltransferase family 4 protein n=1 Tax=Spiribacter roseus TaxID=1855875 RepID=UPI0013303556|nr:glycosyltransferase family 4 protein [Spiribacter roseus]